MADNVAITAGSGTSIATDDVSGVHFQKVKLDVGGDGASSPVTSLATETGNLATVKTNTDPLVVSGGGGYVRQDSTGTIAKETGGNLASAATSLGVMDDWDNAASDGASVSGDVAHDDADAGEPVKQGARAVSSLSGATMVAANDRTNLFAGLDGIQITRGYCPVGDSLIERVTNTDGASTASTVFGATASTRNCITTIVVFNSSTTASGYVDIRDGTAGTVLMTLPLPAGGGAVVNLPVPLITTANTALAFDVSAAISTIYLTFIGFKSKA